MYQLSANYNDKTNEMSYLQAQIQALKEYINGLKNRNQQQQEEEIQIKSYT
jgi:membrane protein insertase Oxa1/YidC/SpoIIIJ